MSFEGIAGEWRGYYIQPRSVDRGCSFNAFIYEQSGKIEGTIIDDYSTRKASLNGSYSSPSIQFTKLYLEQYTEILGKKTEGTKTTYLIAKYDAPVEYEGTVAADGKTMSGTWSIFGANGRTLNSGTWSAYRILDEEIEKAVEKTKKRKQPKPEIVTSD